MKPSKKSTAAELRHRAEAHLKQKQAAQAQALTETEQRRLQHELQVHQIELEMQNEELRTAQEETATTLGKYTDLYDFAPTGYFTFSTDGTVLAVNLTGARLAGFERARLLQRQFGMVLSEGDRFDFNTFLKKVFGGGKREYCEVSIPQAGQVGLMVRIEGVVSADEQECRAAVLDITERHTAALMRERLIRELQEAQSRVKTLTGLLPICSYCKKIRDDRGYWEKVESYISNHSEAVFSHGICPDCVAKYHPECVVAPKPAP